MRSGHLLAEESPHNLLTTHGLTSLEDVFLKLCMKDGVVARPSMKVSATATSGNGYPALQQGVDDAGHDNPAFAQSFNNPDAITGSPVDMVDGHQPQDNGEEDHKNLAQLSIVSDSTTFVLSNVHSFPFTFHFSLVNTNNNKREDNGQWTVTLLLLLPSCVFETPCRNWFVLKKNKWSAGHKEDRLVCFLFFSFSSSSLLLRAFCFAHSIEVRFALRGYFYLIFFHFLPTSSHF